MSCFIVAIINHGDDKRIFRTGYLLIHTLYIDIHIINFRKLKSNLQP